MGLPIDQQEFERLHQLTAARAGLVTTFEIEIRADRAVERREIRALLALRFPWFDVSPPRSSGVFAEGGA
jgi:hypothetical protein